MRRSTSLKAFAYVIIFAGVASLWAFRNQGPLLKFVAAVFLLLFSVKMAALVWQMADGVKPKSIVGLLAFCFAWPGVSFKGFAERQSEPVPETGRNFLESWVIALFGCTLLLAAAFYGRGESVYWNYAALISLGMIVHMGFLESLTDGYRLLGFTPRSLFNRPYLSESLHDFWSYRWNLAFVDMNKLFLLGPLKNIVRGGLLIFGIFLISGILHELGISYPAEGPWGLPMCYFAFQGAGMLLESRVKLPRLVTFAWVLLPLPLLFPPKFVNLFMGMLCGRIYDLVFTLPLQDILRYGFLTGAALNALVLCASVQVPSQLGWHEELQRLRPLNRKAFWTYGAYIFAIIVIMSGVSLHLSGVKIPVVSDFLWAAFIALFWWARIGIDFLYMKHEDWPQGPLFTVGHVCLSTLFLSLTTLFTFLAIILAGGVYG